MGLGSYFKAPKAEPREAAQGDVTRNSSQNEKRSSSGSASEQMRGTELMPPTPRFDSSRNSVSARSDAGSSMLDDIKHEVMVNYLYQQQCSRLWVSDGSGELEGVLLRKARNTYMACPPQLGTSHFARACAASNFQVR